MHGIRGYGYQYPQHFARGTIQDIKLYCLIRIALVAWSERQKQILYYYCNSFCPSELCFIGQYVYTKIKYF